jgi:hypothetical protein
LNLPLPIEGAFRHLALRLDLIGVGTTNAPTLLEVFARRGAIVDAWALAATRRKLAGDRTELPDRIRAAVAKPDNL